jgi:hypothetical protein
VQSASTAFHDFLDGGPTNHKPLLEEHPPGPVSANLEEKCAALDALYGPGIMLSNKCNTCRFSRDTPHASVDFFILAADGD